MCACAPMAKMSRPRSPRWLSWSKRISGRRNIAMSIHLKGAGGAPGIALGRAVLYLPAQAESYVADASPEEALSRLAAAQAAAAQALGGLAERLRGQAEPLISAIVATVGQMRADLEALDDPYLRERAADMDAIGRSILAALHGDTGGLRDLPAGAIIVAPDLTPAETAELR